MNEVVAPAELMNAARRWAIQILECSPMSIRASKQTVLRGLGEASVEAALGAQGQYPAVQAMRASQEVVEGPLAFAEKRKAIWKGR